MKKSLIFVGLLAIGFANAQEYDGKVGINTNEPKATLDITPEASNLTGTTNEGIIAPRLTKTRIANIEASKLTEGTLVYATDAVYTAGADTAKNGRVAKINEKGYYFYNGTEWVKVQYKDTDTNDAEWVYDDSTKRINLKRSGQTTGFTAKVFFDNEKGRYINVDTETVMREANILGADVTSNILTEGSSFNVSHLKADKINFNYSNPRFYYASKDESFLQVNNEAIKTARLHQGGHYSALNTYTYTDANTTENLGSLSGGYFRGIHRGTGKIQNALLGSASNGILKNGSASGLYGAHLYATVHSEGEVTNMAGALGQAHLGKDTMSLNITNASSFWGTNQVNSGGSITNLQGVFLGTAIGGTQTLSVGNLMGLRYSGLNNDSFNPNATVNAHYGIYIDDITKAKDDKNFAVYTNAGKVRVGDLADTSATTDRTVVVDKDGVLKVGTATASTGATTLTGEENLECNATNRGKMNFVKNDAGFDVFGICMKGTNGYSWRYIYGNGGVSTGSGNFGSGLQ